MGFLCLADDGMLVLCFLAPRVLRRRDSLSISYETAWEGITLMMEEETGPTMTANDECLTSTNRRDLTARSSRLVLKVQKPPGTGPSLVCTCICTPDALKQAPGSAARRTWSNGRALTGAAQTQGSRSNIRTIMHAGAKWKRKVFIPYSIRASALSSGCPWSTR